MGLFDFLKKKERAPESAPEVAALVAKLKHSDWKVRFEAAKALGALGARAADARSALEDATSDDHNEVCTAAAEALTAILRALDRR